MFQITENVIQDWSKAKALGPDNYVRYLRVSAYEPELQVFNQPGSGVVASIDEDGDLTFTLTDEELFRRDFHKITGVAPISSETMLDAQKSLKQFRRRIRQLSAEILPWTGSHAERLSEVVIDLLPKLEISAGACPVPGGGDVIILSEGFHHLPLWHIWDLICASIPEEWDGLVERNAMMKFEIAPLVMGRCENPFLTLQSISTRIQEKIVEHRLDPGELQAYSTSRNLATLQFVLLHELGHIALGHTDEARDWKAYERLLEHERQERTATMHRFEFDADRFVAEVIKTKSRDFQPSVARHILERFGSVANDFFILVECSDKMNAVRPSPTHPPALVRKTAVHKLLFDRA